MVSRRIKQDENHANAAQKMEIFFVVQKEQYFKNCIYEKNLFAQDSKHSNVNLP